MISKESLNPLPRLLRVVENSLTVRDIAVTDLWYVAPSGSPSETRKLMVERGFDAAPIEDVRPHLYVEAGWLEGTAAIEAVAQPIDAARLVTADLGLADSIARLKESAFYFVLERGGLYGMVTRADMISPPVGMVCLSLILAAEAGMDLLIRESFPGSSWQTHLSDDRLGSCRRMLELRRQHNVDTTLLDCLMLADRLTLIRTQARILQELGFTSRRALDRWSGRVNQLRDDLAHGGNLLSSWPDPLDAIELFTSIRDIAERIWALADRQGGELRQ